MDDESGPIVFVVLLIIIIVLTEVGGPKIGTWAVWLGRLIAAGIVVFMSYMALGGDGLGTLIVAVVLLLATVAIWLLFGDAVMGGLDKLAQVIIPILVIFNVVTAFADIIAGFRTGSSGLLFAGALTGLIALASAPTIQEPNAIGLVIAIAGIIVGVGAFIKAGAIEAFDWL